MRAAIILFSLAAAIGCGSSTPTVEAPTSAAQKTYPVRFDRPSHVGERSHIVSDHSSDLSEKTTREGTLVADKHEQHTIHYDAVSTVLAVDARGHGTRVRYEVKELTSDGQRLTASLIELTRAAKKKDAEIVVDGNPATGDLRKLLTSLFKLNLEGVTDDEVFGTKTPQPIGAHWNVDSARAIVGFKEDGLEMSTVKGDVWLDGATKMDGVECLTLRATLDLSGVHIPDLPEGAVTEESRGAAEMSATLPIDGGRGTPGTGHLSTTMSFRIRVPAPQGAPMMVSVQSKESQETRETAM